MTHRKRREEQVEKGKGGRKKTVGNVRNEDETRKGVQGRGGRVRKKTIKRREEEGVKEDMSNKY